MPEKAVDTTRRGKSTSVQYARFADDMVILIDAERRSDWLVKAIDKRLREEFAKLPVAFGLVLEACARLTNVFLCRP
jgi:RNA-directed DNA polymerase